MNSIEDLYKRSKQENSPIALDNMILNSAKQSCENSAVDSKRKKWLYALPTAAVVIFSFSLILNLQSVNQEMITLPEQSIVSGNDNRVPKTIKNQTKTNKNMDAEVTRVAAEKKNNTEKLKRRVNTTINPPISPTELSDMVLPPKAEPIANKALSQEQSVVGKIVGSSAQDAGLENDFEFKEKSSYKILEAESLDASISDTNSKINVKSESFVKRAKDKNKKDFLQTEINKIKRLIEHEEFERADVLLKSLKKKYPNVDFSELLTIPKR